MLLYYCIFTVLLQSSRAWWYNRLPFAATNCCLPCLFCLEKQMRLLWVYWNNSLRSWELVFLTPSLAPRNITSHFAVCVSTSCVIVTRLSLHCVCDHDNFMNFNIALFFNGVLGILRDVLVLVVVVFWKYFCHQIFLFWDSRYCLIDDCLGELFRSSSPINWSGSPCTPRSIQELCAWSHCYHATGFLNCFHAWSRRVNPEIVPHVAVLGPLLQQNSMGRLTFCDLRWSRVQQNFGLHIILWNITTITNASDGTVLSRIIGIAAGLIKCQSSVLCDLHLKMFSVQWNRAMGPMGP